MEMLIVISLLIFIIGISTPTGFSKKVISPKQEIFKTDPSEIDSFLTNYDFCLDPLEIKFLYFVVKNENKSLPTDDVNNLIFSNKMSESNLRQRRHTLIKELNIKLFMISNIRESIVRVASEVDKRRIIYCLSSEAKTNNKLLDFIDSSCEKYYHSA